MTCPVRLPDAPRGAGPEKPGTYRPRLFQIPQSCRPCCLANRFTFFNSFKFSRFQRRKGAPYATLDRDRWQCCLDSADGERLRNRLQGFAVGGGIVALPAGRCKGRAGSCAPGGWRDASGSRSRNRGAPRKAAIRTMQVVSLFYRQI